jgi:hypothetical protein
LIGSALAAAKTDAGGFNNLSLLGEIGGGPFPHSEALHMTGIAALTTGTWI